MGQRLPGHGGIIDFLSLQVEAHNSYLFFTLDMGRKEDDSRVAGSHLELLHGVGQLINDRFPLIFGWYVNLEATIALEVPVSAAIRASSQIETPMGGQ